MTIRRHLPRWARRLLLLSLFAVVALPRASAAEPADLEPLKREIRELSLQSIRLRHELTNSPADRALLTTIESALTQLEHILSELQQVANDVDSAAFRVHFLKGEMESKNRALEQVKQITAQLSEEYARRDRALAAESAAIEARRRIFEDQGALDAFDRDVEAYNAKLTALKKEFERVNAERKEAFATAFAACTAALKEFAAAEEKERKAVESQNGLLRQVESTRSQYTEAITTADRRPAQSYGPLTPFPTGGISPTEAQPHLRDRRAPLSTPGTVKDPLRQLRVVVRNSLVAADSPNSIEAKHSSGNKIDTEEGLNDEAVPLVIESPVPTLVDEPGAAPPSVRQPGEPLAPTPPASPTGAPATAVAVPAKVREADAAQREQIARLDALYQKRNEIVKDPKAFGPQALTHVINDISETHGKIIFADYTKKAAGGSKTMIALDVDTDSESAAPPASPPAPPPAPARWH